MMEFAKAFPLQSGIGLVDFAISALFSVNMLFRY